jgi:hypothetical protein
MNDDNMRANDLKARQLREELEDATSEAPEPTPDERERILEDHPDLRASLQRGMDDAAAGLVQDLGSFAEYLEADTSDEAT